MRCSSPLDGTRSFSRTPPAEPVKVISEGVDPSLFCPGPKSGLLSADKFHIFTGGKIEFRKAQDLVLLAFRRFHEKRSDSVLVTAWHSPWPQLVGRVSRASYRPPSSSAANGMLDIGVVGRSKRSRPRIGDRSGLRAQCADADDAAGNGRLAAAVARGSRHEFPRQGGDGLRGAGHRGA